MLFVLVRIEFGTVSNFIVGKTLLTLPGFCVPHFDVSIVGAAQESITNVVEIRVTNGLPAKKGKSFDQNVPKKSPRSLIFKLFRQIAVLGSCFFFCIR